MQIRLLETTEALEAFAEPWRKLHARSGDEDPFASFEWNRTWFVHRYAEAYAPFVVVGYDKELHDPSVVIALMIDKKGRVRFIADGHSDRNLFLFAPEVTTAKKHAFFKKLLSLFREHPDVRSAELRNLCQSDRDFALFGALGAERTFVRQSNAVSWLDLNPSEELWGCFAHLDSKKRSELRRIYKKNADLRSRFLDIERAPFPKERLRETADAMIASGQRDPRFLNPVLMRVIESLYEAGILSIQLLEDEKGKVQAMNLILRNPAKEEWLLWIDLYLDRPYVNIASYLFVVDRLRQTRKTPFRIHFGRGLYEYKRKNFLPEVEAQFTLFWADRDATLGAYLAKEALFGAIKPFYKRHKKTINGILGR